MKKLSFVLFENGDKDYAAKAQAAKDRAQPLDKNSPRFKTLEKFYQGKSVVPRNQLKDLTQEKGKKSGSADGYLAADYTDAHEYMIKTTLAKRPETEFLVEYLTAGAYQRVLFNRAPDIELVQETTQKQDLEHKYQEDAPPKSDKSTLYFRSKFLNNFEAIADIESQAYETNDFSAFKTIQGFAKVIATCTWSGETDAHGYNLGVNKIERIALKIDHGKAGCFEETEEAMRLQLFITFHIGERGSWCEGGARPGTYTLIDCKISELRAALEEITKISDSEIETLIGSRAVKLKKSFLTSIHEESLSKKDTQEYLKFIEGRSNTLIKGLINHRNIIKNDLLKSLEVIEMIGQGPTQICHTDKNGKMLIQKPIEQLIEHALEASENLSELQRLKEIAEHFHKKIIESSKINPNDLMKLTILEQSKNWEALYEFEQLPSFAQIKKLQNLEATQKALILKIQLLQNNVAGYYPVYRAQAAQKTTQLEEEQMAWMIENHKEQLIGFIPEQQEKLKERVLEQNPRLNNLYRHFVEETTVIYRTLNSDRIESIKTLFYPTTDIETKKTRALMIKFLDGNKKFYNRYYEQDKSKQAAQEHRYLLIFMENSPSQVRSLLQDPGLDEADRLRMLSVLESPSNERENKIASTFKELNRLENNSAQKFLAQVSLKAIELMGKLHSDTVGMENDRGYLVPFFQSRRDKAKDKILAIELFLREFSKDVFKPVKDIMVKVNRQYPDFLSGTFQHRESDLIKWIESEQNRFLLAKHGSKVTFLTEVIPSEGCFLDKFLITNFCR